MTPELWSKLAIQIASISATLDLLVEDVLDIRARLQAQSAPGIDPEQQYIALRREFFEIRIQRTREVLELLGVRVEDRPASDPSVAQTPSATG